MKIVRIFEVCPGVCAGLSSCISSLPGIQDAVDVDSLSDASFAPRLIATKRSSSTVDDSVSVYVLASGLTDSSSRKKRKLAVD